MRITRFSRYVRRNIARTYAVLPLFAAFACACASGDVTLGNNYAVKKTSTGAPIGDGQHCSWTSATKYNIGDAVPSPDACNTCRCTAQGIACTTKACATGVSETCSYGGRDYANGASFPASDACNTCTCGAGGVTCTELACGITCTRDGKVYQRGETITDSCSVCVCDKTGNFSCTANTCTCTYNGSLYNVGDVYPATDGCNKCTCSSVGVSNCTAMPCSSP